MNRNALRLATLVAAAALPALAQDANYRPHMDAQPTTFWDARIGLAAAAKTSVKSWDDLWVWDFTGNAEFWYYEHEQGGDFQIGAKWDSWVLNGFDGLSSGYPLVAARFYGRYSQRYQGGFGLNFLFEPGLYTALEQFSTDDLGFPAGIIAEKAFNPSASIQVGAMVYPGFDQTVDPVAGLRLTNAGHQGPGAGAWTLDLGYPETKIAFKPDDLFTVRFGGRILAWPEFQMAEDDKRERIMYDETRVYGGVSYDITESLDISLEAGYLLGRELDFEKSAKAIDIDDTFFFRVGLQGRL